LGTPAALSALLKKKPKVIPENANPKITKKIFLENKPNKDIYSVLTTTQKLKPEKPIVSE
jgi:hypothetical protein